MKKSKAVSILLHSIGFVSLALWTLSLFGVYIIIGGFYTPPVIYILSAAYLVILPFYYKIPLLWFYVFMFTFLSLFLGQLLTQFDRRFYFFRSPSDINEIAVSEYSFFSVQFSVYEKISDCVYLEYQFDRDGSRDYFRVENNDLYLNWIDDNRAVLMYRYSLESEEWKEIDINLS